MASVFPLLLSRLGPCQCGSYSSAENVEHSLRQTSQTPVMALHLQVAHTNHQISSSQTRATFLSRRLTLVVSPSRVAIKGLGAGGLEDLLAHHD